MTHSITFIETVKGRVEFRAVGAGVPVLLFHGGQSSCLDPTFEPVFDPSQYCLYIPSRPGYRGTPLDGNATAAQTADLFAAFLEALQIESAIVVAASLGGRPALEFAAHYPEKTRCLVLGSAVTGPWIRPGGAEYRRSVRLFGPRLEGAVWASMRAAFRLAPRRTARRFLKQLTTLPSPRMDFQSLEALRTKVWTLRSYHGFVHDLDHSLDPTVFERVACPTLIQHSRYDHSVKQAHARRAHARIADSECRWYDNDWEHFLWTGPGSDTAIADLRVFAAHHGR